MKHLATTSFIVLIAIISISFDLNAQPNEISYEIEATLDPTTKTVSGMETIHFRNGTGQALDTLYIYLYPNRFKPGSLVALYEDYEDFDMFFPHGPDWGWLEVTEFRIDGVEVAYDIDGILMSVPLAQPLAQGAEVTLELSFVLQLPNSFRRLGYQGSNHFMSWWYPQMARYDGERWHTDLIVGYSSAEPYQDFASYDVTLTVPSDFVVGTTGALQSEQIFTATKELHYTAQNVHDFAWVADPNYQKDQFDCNGIIIYSLYQPQYAETAQPMAESACDIINYLSERFGQYPYEQFTIAQAGLVFGAMEYPQLIMNGDIFYRIPTHIRYGARVTAHEVAHQWFYGLLMSNQIAETWLDEGFAEFSTIAYMEDRYGTDQNLFDKEFIEAAFSNILVDPYIGAVGALLGGDSVRDMTLSEYISTAKRGTAAPVLTHNGEVPLGKSILPYQKGALTLLALEEYLGRETFDEIMQTYFDRFHFGHPTTADFIAIAEEISGQGLDWFFDAWLRSTEQIDFAVTSIDRQGTRERLRPVLCVI